MKTGRIILNMKNNSMYCSVCGEKHKFKIHNDNSFEKEWNAFKGLHERCTGGKFGFFIYDESLDELKMVSENLNSLKELFNKTRKYGARVISVNQNIEDFDKNN